MRWVRSVWFLFALVAVLAFAAVYWQWSEYDQEKEFHERVMIVRGETVLDSLEAGIRSHRRIGRWFFDNIEAILMETASAPGVKEIAIFDHKGRLIGRGGDATIIENPENQPKESGARLISSGLLISRQTQLNINGTDPAGDSKQGPGSGMGLGRGSGARNPGSLSENDPFVQLTREPLWLSVLLDRKDFDWYRGQSRQRFMLSTLTTIAAILLGIGFLHVLQRQVHLQNELSLSREREKRQAERTQLGAGLAHETKNPLSLIRGLAQSMLSQARKTDSAGGNGFVGECREDTQRIIDEVDRVVGRINSFLEFARAQSPKKRVVRLNELVDETLQLFDDESHAKSVRLESQLEETTTLADPAMIRQILVNLVANALNATPSGGEIKTTIRRNFRTADLVVEDTGKGISEEDLPRVTSPYFTRRKGGSGLGLAIVDQIVQSHGWRMRIHSEEGKGTTITIFNIPMEKSSS
ncbi:MAG: sensor histidine kinase [Candidatus Sumerlaeia bacterium]